MNISELKVGQQLVTKDAVPVVEFSPEPGAVGTRRYPIGEGNFVEVVSLHENHIWAKLLSRIIGMPVYYKITEEELNNYTAQ